MTFTFNPTLTHSLDLMENTSKNIFITGNAGTGKSSLLKYFRSHTEKKIVVLAPTGVAALNVQGQTIHSFFKFKHSVTLESVKKLKESKSKKSIYKQLDTLVIDEISMVRADLLDCMDKFLRLNGQNPDLPFGGLQMIFIGDLYQLPPVVSNKEIFLTRYKSPYFFSAHFFDGFKMEFIELDKIFRQTDDRFIKLLNAVRHQFLKAEDMTLLNTRFKPTYDTTGYVYLTPKNSEADAINTTQLATLKSEPFTAQARIEGTFGSEYYPTHQALVIKVGAQIMMVTNDPKGRFVNGTMGEITKYHENVVTVRLESGKKIDVSPHTWEVNRFFLESDLLKTEVIGSFTQYPFILAWAITIHKSQGKTFDKVVLDIGSGAFMPGQIYVALSRCTSLEGLILKRPLQLKHIWSDKEVVTFVKSLKEHTLSQSSAFEDTIKKCIENHHSLEITYLNAANEKSTRIITPTTIDILKYQNIPYKGLRAFCHTGKDNKIFRLDQILSLKVVESILPHNPH